MSDYRINIRVRNARLLRMIENAGYRPGMIFAAKVGISYQNHLLAYLNLTRTPFDENGDLRQCAERLCIFFNCLPEELWSEEQRHGLASNAAELELSAAGVHEMLSSPMACMDPAVLIEERERGEAVVQLLETIPEREAEVLRLRFGIECEPMTLEDIAHLKGCTRERIRQIECKALRHLRMQRNTLPLPLRDLTDVHAGGAA